MPMARTRRGRLRQIEHWLNAECPTPRPTYVEMHNFSLRKGDQGGDFADTIRVGRRVRIRIDSRLTWYLAIHFLLHEWAHAVSWPLAAAELRMAEHSPEFGLAYADILTKFHDKEGWKDSRDYPWE